MHIKKNVYQLNENCCIIQSVLLFVCRWKKKKKTAPPKKRNNHRYVYSCEYPGASMPLVKITPCKSYFTLITRQGYDRQPERNSLYSTPPPHTQVIIYRKMYKHWKGYTPLVYLCSIWTYRIIGMNERTEGKILYIYICI